MWFVLMLSISLISCAQCTDTKTRSMYFQKESVKNDINDAGSIVVGRSKQVNYFDCAYACSRLSSTISLHFDEKTFECYCNSQKDKHVVSSPEADSVIYGVITRAYETVRNADGEVTYFPKDGVYGNCQEIFDAGYRVQGLYIVQETITTTKEMFCSMGWTVFQRRFDGSVDFYRNWTEYVTGFGNLSGEFWLGLEAIHQQTATGSCELMIYMEAEAANPVQASGYAKYDSFWLDGADANYKLHVSDFSGTVGDSFSNENNSMFSTYDADNDERPTRNCALTYKGGWWYNRCHSTNLNGLYLNGTHASFADGMGWLHPWGRYYSLLKTEMMFKCK